VKRSSKTEREKLNLFKFQSSSFFKLEKSYAEEKFTGEED
jgi:hypothetical protein